MQGEAQDADSYTVAEGTTLKKLFETEIADGETFESTLDYTIWTVNGNAASADTVLKNGDIVIATVSQNFIVSVQTIFNGADQGTESYTVANGSTLKQLFENKMGDGATFESTLDYTVWTVNGNAATADTVLAEGDVIVATVTIVMNDVSVKVVYNGVDVGTTPVSVREGTTLKALFEEELGDGETLPGYYEISKIQPYDMVPQTKHVETLVCLARKA